MRRRLIRWLARYEGRAAWALLVGAFVTFGGVVTNLIATGDAKWVTLLASADLFVSSVSSLQQAYGDELDDER